MRTEAEIRQKLADLEDRATDLKRYGYNEHERRQLIEVCHTITTLKWILHIPADSEVL